MGTSQSPSLYITTLYRSFIALEGSDPLLAPFSTYFALVGLITVHYLH